VSRSLTTHRIRDVARITLAASLALVVAAGVTTFRIWQQGDQDEARAADAIVVLGAAQYAGRPSPVFAARLEHAVALWQQGVAPALIVTGGKVPGDTTTEAAVARQYAIAHGVPESAIFGEDEARNTLGSMRSVATLMRERGLHSAVFVSDPTHMLRVLRLASDLGIEGFGSPTRTSPVQADPWARLQATVHELGALAVYFVTGGEPDPAGQGG
jgi:uncharacterized SAM-binding protein YcdF (DUF218 family)